MSGWDHGKWPSVRVDGKFWTERVLKIAAVVGHRLGVDSEKDRGIQGRYHASHAEKQLIAYFLDRHVFLPEERTLDSYFDEEIDRLENEINEMASEKPIIEDLFRLREEQEDLERELSNEDNQLLGDEYDEELVNDLKRAVGRLQ